MKARKGETKQQYVNRFCESKDNIEQYPNFKHRRNAALAAWEAASDCDESLDAQSEATGDGTDAADASNNDDNNNGSEGQTPKADDGDEGTQGEEANPADDTLPDGSERVA